MPRAFVACYLHTMDDDTLANALGALAVRMADEVHAAVTSTGYDATAIGALVHLSKYPDQPIEGLRVPLELSHSGCVRLVDRLVEGGLVERRGGAPDARAVALHVTRKGREAAAVALRARQEVLARTIHLLSPNERASLEKLLRRLLPQEVPSERVALRACRYCDYGACRSCPLGSAV